MSVLCPRKRIPILAGPLVKANCPTSRTPSVSPPSLLQPSHQHSIYLHTDDINSLDSSSVGHNNVSANFVFTMDLETIFQQIYKFSQILLFWAYLLIKYWIVRNPILSRGLFFPRSPKIK